MNFLDTDVLIDIQRQYPPAMAWLKSKKPRSPLAQPF